MRKFTGLLFLGAGRFSVRGRVRLHARLDEALDLSGGLQQPDLITSRPDPARDEHAANMAEEVRDAARDLVAALTGRDMSFGEVLSPPEREFSDPLPIPSEALRAVEREFAEDVLKLGAKYLGSGGRVSTLLRALAELSPEERQAEGAALNEFTARVKAALRPMPSV